MTDRRLSLERSHHGGTFRRLLIIVLPLAGLVLWRCGEDGHDTVIGPEAPLYFIDSTYPADEAIDVPVRSSIIIQFLRPMDMETMIGRRFYFSGNHMYSFSADSTRAALYPDRLRHCAGYQVIIDSGLVDKEGNVMTEPYSFSFQTESGNEFISSIHPLNHATDAPIHAVITVTFTRDMDPATIHSGAFYIDGYVDGTIGYSNRMATITPTDSFEPGQTYTVTLKSSVADTSGTTMGEDYIWSFTTEKIDSICVVSESPADGATRVSINTGISVTFSREIDPSSLTPDEFTVGDVAGSLFTFSRTVRFIPEEKLQYETTYTPGFTGDISDMAGNVAQINYTWSFTTIDSLPPEIVEIYPPDGATNVLVNADPWVVFSKPIDPRCAAHLEFTIARLDKSGSEIIVSHDTVKLIAGDLIHDTPYRATFRGRVSDMEGNASDFDLNWSFRTFEYLSVVARYPDVGCVPLDANVIMEFNRDVDPATVIPDNFILEDINGERLTGSLSSHDSVVIFDPDLMFSPLETYRMTVQNVTDIYGYGLPSAEKWSFSTKGENLFPLAVGNKWRYRVSLFEGYHCGPPYATCIDSILIVGDTLVDGKTYYVDQRGDLYRYANDSIETTFHALTMYWHSKYEFENMNCANGGSVIIGTDIGEFLCQYFNLSFTVYNHWDYDLAFNFAPDVGLVHFSQVVREPCSDLSCTQFEDWDLIGYEMF